MINSGGDDETDQQTDKMGYTCPVCAVETVEDSMMDGCDGPVLCDACVERATDSQGRRVRMFNVSMSGGFQALFADGAHADRISEEVTSSHIVFVQETACYANERRFGGIYVRLAEDERKELQAYAADEGAGEEGDSWWQEKVKQFEDDLAEMQRRRESRS